MKRSERDSIELTDLQRQFMYGSLLGDAYIFKHLNNRPRFGAQHGVPQRDYVWWKYHRINNLCARPPRNRIMRSGYKLDENGVGHRVIIFTRSLRCLEEIYDVTMQDRKKVVTDEWANMIQTAMPISTWYMDDGFLSTRLNASGVVVPATLGICIGISTEIETDILLDLLKRTSGVNFKVQKFPPRTEKYKETTILRIGDQQNISKFADYVRPHIIPSMGYKLRCVDSSSPISPSLYRYVDCYEI